MSRCDRNVLKENIVRNVRDLFSKGVAHGTQVHLHMKKLLKIAQKHYLMMVACLFFFSLKDYLHIQDKRILFLTALYGSAIRGERT